jgi:hypothetical protein
MSNQPLSPKERIAKYRAKKKKNCRFAPSQIKHF